MRTVPAILVAAAALLQLGQVVPDSTADSQLWDQFHRYLRFGSYLSDASVRANWLNDGNAFWYRGPGGAGSSFFTVDALTNVVREFSDEAAFQEVFPGAVLERAEQGLVKEAPRTLPDSWYGTGAVREIPSPDGRWFVGLDGGNLVVRLTGTDSILRLTSDGSQDRPWGDDGLFGWQVNWSPDSQLLVVKRLTQPVLRRYPRIHYPLAEEAERGAVPAVMFGPDHSRSATPEMWIFQVPSGNRIRVQVETWQGQRFWFSSWTPDSSRFLTSRLSDGGQSVELLSVDPRDGTATILMQEDATEGYLYPPNVPLRWWFLDDGTRFLLRSEADGWQQLYLYDVREGLIRQLTRAPYSVRWVQFIDEARGWVYYTAHPDPKRPYDRHLMRVKLQGGTPERLTSEAGQHQVQFSPSGDFFIDEYASSTIPMRSDLKDSSGRLIRRLSAASDSSFREELDWTEPEEFLVQVGNEGTPIFGHLFKPSNFDPARRYPVIDYFYGHAHGEGAVVLRPDGPGQMLHPAQALAQLGFVVVSFEERGSFWRGRAFRHATYGRGAELEIADHVSVLNQLAGDRPWMDLSRVGSFGYSLFGFFAARALLLRPDVYRVGVSASAPDILLTEDWDQWYYVSSVADQDYRANHELADRLEGKLLLTIGTEEVGLANMIPLIDGLVRSGKQYDLRLITGAGHSMFWPGAEGFKYFWDTVGHYFLDHLAQ